MNSWLAGMWCHTQGNIRQRLIQAHSHLEPFTYCIKADAFKEYLWVKWCVSDVNASIFSALSEVFFWHWQNSFCYNVSMCTRNTRHRAYKIIWSFLKNLKEKCFVPNIINEFRQTESGILSKVVFTCESGTHLCYKIYLALKNQHRYSS